MSDFYKIDRATAVSVAGIWDQNAELNPTFINKDYYIVDVVGIHEPGKGYERLEEMWAGAPMPTTISIQQYLDDMPQGTEEEIAAEWVARWDGVEPINSKVQR